MLADWLTARGLGHSDAMRWVPGRKSDQIEDRRGEGGVTRAGGSGNAASLLVFLFRKFGIAGVLVGAAGLYFMGAFSGGGAGLSAEGRTASPVDEASEEPAVQFVSFVLDDAQTTFQRILASGGAEPYRSARLVLFRGSTRSDCGLGQAEMGPFYCQRDEKVYLDLGFFDDLQKRFGASGDFAQAYVIAHELGHHVQNILGAFARTRGASAAEQEGDKGLSVRLELQADCYAGVWGHSAQQRNVLETGDLEEALKAASVIGDDALQRKASGTVRPETFTHGSSAQRARWFRRGFDSGDMQRCDTFAATRL